MCQARMRALTLAVAGCAVLSSDRGAAQGTAEAAVFRPPVRIKAGDAFLGAGRLYPSPVLHDIDGDDRPDIVVGDLIGQVTFAPRTTDGSSVAFGAEKKLEDRRGKQLRFHNW